MVTPVIVTLDQLLAHLRLAPFPLGSPASPDEADLQAKLDAATQAVIDYIVRPETEADIAAWTPPASTPAGSPSTAAPAVVCAAVLITAGDLYRDRGDEGTDTAPRPHGDLPVAAVTLLKRRRDPALA